MAQSPLKPASACVECPTFDRKFVCCMEVAFDAKRYFNNATGLGFYSRTLLDGLRRFYPENRYWLYTPYNKGRFVPSDEFTRLPDTWIGKTLHPLWRSRGITAQLQRDGVSLYHGLSHELPSGLHRAGIKSVVSVHDLIFMRHPELYPFIDRYFYKLKYKKAVEEADAVVAISEQTKSDLVEFFGVAPARIRVIGQSCDPVFAAASIPSVAAPGDYFISVGSLSPRKNWHTLLDALALLKQEGFEVPLVAVGSGKGAYVEQLKAQALQLGIEVRWMGYLPSEQLAALYRNAAALVYPSLFEGFGIPVLEALTVGIPVVTSKGGCFEEVGGQAALYADPADAADLARQMQQTLSGAVRAELATHIDAAISRFRPERVCAEWIGLYRQLLEG